MFDLKKWISQRRVSSPKRKPIRIRLESLEDRTTPVTNFVVDTLGDVNDGNFGVGELTLREAVDQANVTPDTCLITFAPALTAGGDATIDLLTFDNGLDGTEVGPTAFLIQNDITIQGPTGANGVIISRNIDSAFRLFHVTQSGALTLENLTLQGGLGRGFTGGGGFAGGGGSAGLGGAIFNENALTIRNSTFTNNRVVGGDGGWGDLESAGGGGGAGLGEVGGDALDGPGPGGGPNGGVFADGGFGGGGGGDFIFEGSQNFDGGFGGGGGGQQGGGGAGGFGGGGGGGGGIVGGAGGFGGGAGAVNGGGGAGMGGAIFNNGGSVTVENSTFSGNSALGGAGDSNGQALGGAIFNRNGTLSVLNATLTNNTAANGGRGIFNLGDDAPSTVTLNNTLIGQTDTTVSDFEGGVLGRGVNTTSGVGNLISTQVNFAGTIISTADPLLGGLLDNGGPTPTHALFTASPAKDAGDNSAAAGLTNDQRGPGFSRITDVNVDVGAFETAETPPVATNRVVVLNEDTTYAFQLSDFDAGFTDSHGRTLQAIRITALPNSGTLALGGAPVTVGQVIPRASITTLTYTPAQDQTGGFSFGWNGSNGVMFAVANASIFPNVRAVNDAPVNVVPANTSTPKNQPITFTNAFTVSDVDARNLFVRVQGHRATVTINGASAATIRNNGQFVVFLNGPITEINRALSSVTLSPVIGTIVAASLNITTNDHGLTGGGWKFDSDTVVVSMTGNRAPVPATGDVSAFQSFTVAKNTTLNVTAPNGVARLFTDPDGDIIRTYRLLGPKSGNQAFRSNGSFTYSPAANFVGDVFFTIRAFDGQSFGSTVLTVTIHVV